MGKDSFNAQSISDQRLLAFACETLQHCNDPEYGEPGNEILDTLVQNNCKVYIEDCTGGTQNQGQRGDTAAYLPFTSNHPDCNFTNTIKIRPTDNPYKLTKSFIHEGVHAAAWNKTPVLHASPYNTGSPHKPDIIIAPEDWVRLVILTEQDAYAKEQWLCALATQHDPQFAHTGLKLPQNFNQMRAQGTNLHDALVYAANESMNVRNVFGDTFGHYYVGQALRTYENCAQLRQSPDSMIPVRIDWDDFLQAAESIGPNIAGDNRLFAQNGQWRGFMLDHQIAQMQKLNDMMGITNTSTLPTLKEALASHNMTPEQFISGSKTSKKALVASNMAAVAPQNSLAVA